MLKVELIKMMFVSLPMVLTPAFNVLFLVLVARTVNLTLYGNLSYGLALISILVGFSDLGLRDYFLSKDGITKKYSSGINLFVISVFVFLCILILQYYLLEFEGQLSIIFLILLGEAFALGVLHKVVYFKYQSDDQLPVFSKYDSIFKVIPAAVKISALYQTKDLVFALVLSSVISLAIYGGWLFRLRLFDAFQFRTVISDLKALFIEYKSWGFYTISFVSFFLYFGADRLVVEYVLGVEQLAIYSASMAFMSVGQIFVGVLWSLYMPRLSRGEKLWSYNRFMLVVTAFSIPLVFSYLIFSIYLFSYVYPVDYQEGGAVLAVSALYFIFRFPNVVMEIYFIVDGKYNAFVKMRILFGFISLALSFSLLPVLGILGAALALVISEMLLMLSSLLGRRRQSC
ncbi:hypothetical protein N7365_10735 [Pseudomonas sediminis]|uniref:hypothetical protein n=1 Tax=Pseudomonas sediminis TaxID=1691904 RepID=UPI002447F0F8|nr:hypothetical protein [Pseudomonas sediminis]MDG9758572.1 hypothetical protein [Pseudomonas sediminis]